MNALAKAQITIPRQWVVQIPEVNLIWRMRLCAGS